MTEETFGKRLTQLWLAFVVVGGCTSLVLKATRLSLTTQKGLYLGVYGVAFMTGFFWYARAERSKTVAICKRTTPALRSNKWKRVLDWLFLLLMQAGLVAGVWMVRSLQIREIGWGLIGVALSLGLNFMFSAQAFLVLRIHHLRRENRLVICD